MTNNLNLLQGIRQQQQASRNSLLEFTHFGYMWTSVNTKRITASHSIYKLLELEPYAEFLTVQKWRQFVHPKDLYKLIQAEEQLMLSGEQCAAEYRLITSTGKHIYVNHIMQLSAAANNDFKIMSLLDEITEQKSAEVILEVMNEGFYELDKNFVFRRINEGAENYWGIARTNLLNNCIWDVFPQYNGTACKDLLTKAKAGERIITEIVCPVTNHWLHLSVSPHNDGIIVIFYDIQSKKDAEEKQKITQLELRANQNLLEAAANTSPLGMVVVKSIRNEADTIINFEYAWMNAIVTNDFTGENITGARMLEKYPHVKEIGLFDKFVNAAEHNIKVDFEEYFEPFKRWFRWIAVKLDDGLFISIEEITKRKQAEIELAKNQILLQSVFDTSIIGMSVMQAVRNKSGAVKDFKIQLTNKKLEETTQRTDLVGKFYLKEYPGVIETGLLDIMLKVLETGEPARLEYYYPHEGFNRWFLSTFTKLEDSIVATNLDITEAKQAEEKVRIANHSLKLKNNELEQRNKELMSLSRVASRDLKEPLRKIYTAAEAIITGDAQKLSNNGRAHLRRMQSSVQRMGLITDDLLSFVNVSEAVKNFSLVNLNDVLNEAKNKNEKFVAEKNAVINADNLPVIKGDYNLLVQLFKNILHNSIKFQPDHTPEINITSQQVMCSEKPFIKISFKDNGIGFKQQRAEEVFNLFTKLHDDEKFRGSGIGLAIGKKIMEVHNGSIDAISEENDGTDICCYFPDEQSI